MLNEDIQQFFKACFGFRLALAAIQFTFETDAKRAKKARENRLNQGFFRAEVIVHRSQIDSSLTGDQAQGSLGETLLRKQLLCRIENTLDSF